MAEQDHPTVEELAALIHETFAASTHDIGAEPEQADETTALDTDDDRPPLDDDCNEQGRPWRAQSWAEFRDTSPAKELWLVLRILTLGALGFNAGPPKKGKTWFALALSIAIATGKALFGEFTVPDPRPVLYVALEGSRAGLRARIGALARGLGLDPDGQDLDNLHVLYRPRPFDLVDLEAATWLREEAERLDAALIVVDVLRAAVGRFRENDADDFARVREALMPLLAAGRTVLLLHHFGKLNDTQKERSPGERMSGTGAMYGALDVGFLIVRSEDGARRMRVEVEARDFAAPDPIGLVIEGTGTGENGGFTYTDTARLVVDPTAAEERELVAEVEALFADGKWRILEEITAKKKGGIGANKDEVRALLANTPSRFVLLDDPRRITRNPTAKPWGTVAMLCTLEEAEKVAQAAEPSEPPSLFEEGERQVGQVAPPEGGKPSHLPLPTAREAASSHPATRATIRRGARPARRPRSGVGDRVTAAGGLSLADLARRLPERRLPWLAGVVLDEVAAGRVTCDPDGRYRLVPRAFEGDVLRALRSLDREAMRRAPA